MSTESFTADHVDPEVLVEVTTKKLKELQSLASTELYQEVKKLEEDYQKMPDRLINLNQFITVLNYEIKELKQNKELRSQEQKGDWSNSKNSKGELFKKHFTSKLKVFPVVAGTKTFGAHNEILKKVKVDVCSNPEDCKVVVLFCPVLSRVASDVDDAMRKIPDSLKTKQVILVVMHHRRKDITPTEAQLNHGHQNVVMNMHVLFHETVNGLLKCERNTLALKELQDMCKAMTKSQDS